MAATFKTTRQFKHTFTFRWKDGEKEEVAEVWALFNLYPVDEIEERYQKALDDPKNTTANQALLSVYLAGFGGLDMEDANGKPLPDDLMLEAARNDLTLASVLIVEYNQGRSGIGLGDEGNSTPKT